MSFGRPRNSRVEARTKCRGWDRPRLECTGQADGEDEAFQQPGRFIAPRLGDGAVKCVRSGAGDRRILQHVCVREKLVAQKVEVRWKRRARVGRYRVEPHGDSRCHPLHVRPPSSSIKMVYRKSKPQRVGRVRRPWLAIGERDHERNECPQECRPYGLDREMVAEQLLDPSAKVGAKRAGDRRWGRCPRSSHGRYGGLEGGDKGDVGAEADSTCCTRSCSLTLA